MYFYSMADKNIFIFDEIGIDVTLDRVMSQLDSMARQDDDDEDSAIRLIIDSPGGFVDDGFAIINLIRSQGKTIKTEVMGTAFSMAFPIFLAAPFENRIMHPNSRVMLHNPFGGVFGDADELEKGAIELRKSEERIAAFIAANTDLSQDKIKELMAVETFLSRAEAIDLGIVPDVLPVELKAVAKLKSYTEMAEDKSKETNEKIDKMENAFSKVLAKITNLFPDKAPETPPIDKNKEPDVPSLTEEQQAEFDKLKSDLDAKEKEMVEVNKKLEEMSEIGEMMASMKKEVDALKTHTIEEPDKIKADLKISNSNKSHVFGNDNSAWAKNTWPDHFKS